MSLKHRLQRLPKSPDAPAGRTSSLEQLRQKMAEIIERAPPSAAVCNPPQDGFEELGFERHALGSSWCWRRRYALSPSHHVGRFPVTGVGSCDPRILSLLALDPEVAEVSYERALFLDTETTGLGGGAGTLAFLLGLSYFEEGRLWVDQLMLEGPEQEPVMLETLRGLLLRHEVLVTFNGKAFDWPLLEGRYVLNGLEGVGRKPHLDLLHVARRIHRERLARCTLKHIESEVLGFERHGDVEGVEVAARYTHYLRTGDVTGLTQVVEHNRWDVVSMAALVALYGEPLPALCALDLSALARTFQRAKALPEALAAAEAAVQGGAGARGLAVRGAVLRARGDRLAALRDLSTAATELSDPKLRLQLAKLYEHAAFDPERALATLEQGLAEKPAAVERRRARLLRKLQRQGLGR